MEMWNWQKQPDVVVKDDRVCSDHRQVPWYGQKSGRRQPQSPTPSAGSGATGFPPDRERKQRRANPCAAHQPPPNLQRVIVWEVGVVIGEACYRQKDVPFFENSQGA